jgi:UDP-N-acetylglucosamine 2-epimerase (non-hydrolysing)
MTSAVLVVVGARPNFVKVAPIVNALQGTDLAVRLLHTGQHYDPALSDVFFNELGLPEPDVTLGVGSGTHAEQTAGVLVGVERYLLDNPVAAMLVAGDVNSTLAAALAAAKVGVPVIHIEAGLRSGDWTMPEEVNRVLTDRLSGLLLCPSADATENLAREGIEPDRIVLVGNTMIDSLLCLLEAAPREDILRRHTLDARGYVLVTLHRPALVDDADLLLKTLTILGALASRLPVILPLHPRTRARLDAMSYLPPENLVLLTPLTYLEFIALEANARLVVTDSGGVQEETTVLGVPCLTYRTTTERPITISHGTNRLVGLDPQALGEMCAAALDAEMPSGRPDIPLWDGHAGSRAARAIATFVTTAPRSEEETDPPADLARTS